MRFRPEALAAPTGPTLDRVAAAGARRRTRFVAPEVATTTLDNGLEIFVVERRELPKVAVSFSTRAGIVADTAGKQGTAQSAMRTIDLGTKTRSALAHRVGARRPRHDARRRRAARDRRPLGFEVLTRNLAAALAIVADVVQTRPFRRPRSIARRSQLDDLEQQNNDPGASPPGCANMLAFGASIRMAGRRRVRPDRESAHPRRIAALHAARVKAGRSALIFVGGVTR